MSISNPPGDLKRKFDPSTRQCQNPTRLRIYSRCRPEKITYFKAGVGKSAPQWAVRTVLRRTIGRRRVSGIGFSRMQEYFLNSEQPPFETQGRRTRGIPRP